MSELTFIVPLPPTALSPNHTIGSLGARMAKSKRYDEYREHVRFIAVAAGRDAGWKPPPRARISLVYAVLKRGKEPRPKSRLDVPYRPQDWDNAVAAFKAGQDGLVIIPDRVDKEGKFIAGAPGVLLGDDRKHLEGGQVSFELESGPWVRVTIEALE